MHLELFAGVYRMLKIVPIEAMLEAGARADSVGAILDPTLYRAKADALHFDMKVLRAAHAFQAAVDDAMAKAAGRG